MSHSPRKTSRRSKPRCARSSRRGAPFVRQVWTAKPRSFLRGQRREVQGRADSGLAGNREITLYSQGDWVDLCRGPHMRTHRRCRHGVQADEGRGRVLARRSPQRDAAPHLRHRLARPEGTRRPPAHAGGGGTPRPPPHRQGDGPVPSAGGSARLDLLAPERWKLYRKAEDYMRRRLDAPATRRCKTPQLVDRALWEAPATGRSSARTCSSPRWRTRKRSWR